MKYICLDCQHMFNTPRHFREMSPGEPLPFDEWDGCPECGGDYVPLTICDFCGEPIASATYYKIYGSNIACENCVEKVTEY